MARFITSDEEMSEIAGKAFFMGAAAGAITMGALWLVMVTFA